MPSAVVVNVPSIITPCPAARMPIFKQSLFLLVVVGLSLLLLLHRWPFGLYRLKPSAVRAFIRKSLPDLRHL
jgi:hypothetical protein